MGICDAFAAVHPRHHIRTGIQMMLAVLARGYDWEVDLNEPLKTFPLPTLAWGLLMTFKKLQWPVTAAEE